MHSWLVGFKKTLKQKTFRPEGLGEEQIDSNVAGNFVKNYAVRDRFGNNRDFRPPWKDPNPIKYGGKYGMQRLKELSDTAYYREKNADAFRQEIKRKAELNDEDRESEEKKRLENLQIAKNSMKKLQNIVDSKHFLPDESL